MQNKNIFFVLMIIVFFVFLFVLLNSNDRNIRFVKIAGENIKVELATTDKARTMGLSGRTSLEENKGLLFVFEDSGFYPFWMKDMNFPIDIIWLDENFKVVFIKANATPESFPGIFTPDQKSKYVLEIVAGFSEKHNLQVGDRVEFTY